MTSKPPEAANDDGESSRPFGRNRVDSMDGSEDLPGPRFSAPPPRHPVLIELHTFWIEATDDSIGGLLERAREIAIEAPEEVRTWADDYVEALERLEVWLRDR